MLTLSLKHLPFFACSAENYSKLLKLYFEMLEIRREKVLFPNTCNLRDTVCNLDSPLMVEAGVKAKPQWYMNNMTQTTLF